MEAHWEAVEHESDLYGHFVREMMPQLGLVRHKHNVHVPGRRDRMDSLCHDAAGETVVVELKREEGQGAVEQVMRYIGALKRAQGPGGLHVRGVVISHMADPTTRRAFEGRERDEHIGWWIYEVEAGGRIKLHSVLVKDRGPSSDSDARPGGRDQDHCPTSTPSGQAWREMKRQLKERCL